MSLDWEPPLKQCPACRSDEIKFAFEMLYWRDYPLRFHDCAGCGASFSNPMPSVSLISRGNNALVKLYQQGRTFEHEFRDARQAYLRGRLLARKLNRWKKRGRLLEIGCYDGFFLAGVKEHSSWDVEGVEIAQTPADFARSRLGLKIHTGVLEARELSESNYDYVLCSDLIEHINRPEVFLSELSRVVKPGGRLQIITPNARQDLSFARRAYRAGSPVNMLLNHVIYYSPQALKTALKGAGFKIRKIYCYDVRHSLKDFGWVGAEKISPQPTRTGFDQVESIAIQDLRSEWTEWDLAKLRVHPKTRLAYGFYRETLPGFFRLKVPASLALGHEIFALAEKD